MRLFPQVPPRGKSQDLFLHFTYRHLAPAA